MPLYEYTCEDCGSISEILVIGTQEIPKCRACSSTHLTKQISAHAPVSGNGRTGLPGLGDTACCGSAPGQASGCAGPGSCCGKSG